MPVRTERRGAVTTVVLSRPEVRNAVDRPTAAALADAFRAFEADDEARVAVLWGEGGTICAGADLKALGTGRGNRVAEDGDGPMGPTRMRLSKPVIAAVAGHAVAGGLELALWCDLRVAEEDAVFGVYCRRWGVPLIDGGTVRLPRLIGTSRALDRWGWPTGWCPWGRPVRRPRKWPRCSRGSRRRACVPTAPAYSIRRDRTSRPLCAANSGTGQGCRRRARRAPPGSSPGRDGMARSRTCETRRGTNSPSGYGRMSDRADRGSERPARRTFR